VIILAFETATEACSVALWRHGEMRERFEVAPRRHAALALPWADELLSELGVPRSQIDAIAVGVGPGAFTGVRLAVALAQGIALGLDIPVVPVSTLAVLAQSGTMPTHAWFGDSIVAAIDARMGEVYLGHFRVGNDGLVVADGAEVLVAPDAAVLHPDPAAIGVGSGFNAVDCALRQRLGLERVYGGALPRASSLASLAVRDFAAGHAIAADALEPAYLRDRVALTLVEQGKA
jgi:tRNA threonylcarbamoyladenosine biosynthesis protein TsaB